MVSSAPSGLPEFAAIAIGAGVGGLVLLALGVVIFYTYSRRKANAIREIEGGLETLTTQAVRKREKSRTASRTTSKTDLLKQRLGPPVPYGPAARWRSLSSNESINRVSASTSAEKHAVSAFGFPANNHPANNLSPRSKRVRLGHAFSVKGSGIKALSAIIESPRSARSVSGATAVRLHDSSSTTDLTNSRTFNEKAAGSSLRLVQNASDHASISPLPPKSYPTFKKQRFVPTEPAEVFRPIPMRSKSVGILPDELPPLVPDLQSFPKRPAGAHMRSINYGATTAGPAPTCPLPPLPRLQSPKSVSREGTPDITDAIMPQAGRDRAYSDLVGQRNDSELNWQSVTSAASERQDILSFDSNIENGNRNSITGLTLSLGEAGDRLSLPRIATTDRVSISRVSSVDSSASDASLRTTSTPILSSSSRPKSGTRVSITGSPAQRQKTSTLLPISGNACLLTPTRKGSTAKHNSAGSTKTNASTPKSIIPSAMKGSPTARKGHRRQNCVRISKTVVEFFPPPSRSVSPSLEGIAEESPEGGERRATFGPAAPELRPPTAAKAGFPSRSDPVKTVKLRASLTPSSPTLSMSRFHIEFPFPSNVVLVQPEDKDMSRESSIFSIPTMASFTDVSFDQDTTTPAIEVTRPSCDLDVPEDDELDMDNSPELPQHANFPRTRTQPADMKYDPGWEPLIEEATQGYDPLNPTHSYPSPSSSPVSLPRAAKEFVFNCSDPMTMACPPMYFDDLSSIPSSPPPLPIKAEYIPLPESTMTDPISVHESVHQSPLISNPPTRSVLQIGSDHFMDVPLFSAKAATPPITITPHTRAQSRQASILGPRSQPTRNVRETIERLRRMNSDIYIPLDDKVGGQRYFKLGRETSPSLPFTGFGNDEDNDDDFDEALLYEQTSDEVNDTTRQDQTKQAVGFDFGFLDTENHDPSVSFISKKVSTQHFTTAQQIPALVTQSSRNPSSGRDSERKTWHDVIFSPLPPHLPSHQPMTHGLESIGTDLVGRGFKSRITALRAEAPGTPRGGVSGGARGSVRASMVATPGSLYDAEGFLRA